MRSRISNSDLQTSYVSHAVAAIARMPDVIRVARLIFVNSLTNQAMGKRMRNHMACEVA